ncbi:amidoligase family protein [Gilvimarinus sp. F26214L]|uniref:amidoligase family protein n=1 Tax=Gilvimarinus sp. DZF01 TaxID=3461371 RepID=UPI0040461AD3
MTRSFRLPPQVEDDKGEVRRVGFEFEVGNVGVKTLAEALAARLGGRVEMRSSFEAVLNDSALGRLKVERDTRLLTSLAYRDWLGSVGVDFSPGSEGERWERSVDHLSRQLIPCEVVTGPIPMTELASLHQIVQVIESVEGEGTQMSIYYAFGLHMNPSIPSASSESLLAYLQSFLLLSDWIIEDAGTDFTRRFFTKYIDPFPKAYMEMVLDPLYQPDLQGLIRDYLRYNPTRNRSLDMLPIFVELDPDGVLAHVKESERSLIKGRPAYHYRLPDCRVGEPGWKLEDEWNRWQLVEVLAFDRAQRQDLLNAWQQEQARFRLSHRVPWLERVRQFAESVQAE